MKEKTAWEKYDEPELEKVFELSENRKRVCFRGSQTGRGKWI